jgi:hypothetical protein
LLEPIFLAWTSYEKEIPYGKMGPYGFSQESWRCWIHKHKDNELMFALQMALQNRERERGDNTLCCNLLRQKYLGEKGVFDYKKYDGSQFWKGLMAVRGDVARGMIYEVGNGKKTRFWHNV